MPKERHREPGRVVRIPLGDGSVGWGRQLRGVRVEFYDRFDSEADAEKVEPRAVAGTSVAFSVPVMDYAFRREGNWTLLDVVPLSEHEGASVYRMFKRDVFAGAFSIYWEGPDGTWGEDAATRDQCVGLEVAAVYDPEHVEERLRDYRAGGPSRWGGVQTPKT